MAKIAYVSPPYLSDYMRNARCDFVSLSSSSWFPIWLGQAASWADGKGHLTVLMDSQVEGKTHEEAYQDIDKFDPDVVVVYTGRLSEDNDIEFGDKVAENKKRKVVFAGPYTSIDPEKVLRKAKNVKLAIKKEFDLPVEELASGIDPKTTPNFYVKNEDGVITHTECRPHLNSEILGQFPLTSEYFHKNIDVRRYKTTAELYPFLDVMSGRGCAWGRCNFCLWVQSFVDGSVYNLRPIDHFLDEFEYITKEMPFIQSVMIQDDMLTNKRAREISEGILERGYKINWSCYAKPNSNMTPKTLELMKSSGCLNLHVGFESGDEEVLKLIDKGSTVEQAKKFAKDAHAAGLQIHGDFAMGHYGETKDSMKRTLELAKIINPHTAQFQIMIPFEGTKFVDQLKDSKCMNEKGEPSYEAIGGVSNEEIRSYAKYAYRSFYFSGSYVKKILTNPKDYLFNRFDTYMKALPAMTYKRWVK